MKALKILTILAISTLAFYSPREVMAHEGSIMNMGMPGSSEDLKSSIDEERSHILKDQEVSNLRDIDCSKISTSNLMELGDLIMEVSHPGEEHEFMDNMMGGEGSETLKNMHVSMGKTYLGCDNQVKLTNNSLDSFDMDSDSMMGWNNSKVIYNSRDLLDLFLKVSMIGFALSGVYFFLKKSNKK